MKAGIAISNTRDPLRDPCAEVVSIGTTPNVEQMVDLVIQRSGGPYIRVRMDVEGARAVGHDLLQAADRATSKAPSGAHQPYLVVKIRFYFGALQSEVVCGAADEDQASIQRDASEEADVNRDWVYMVVSSGGV